MSLELGQPRVMSYTVTVAAIATTAIVTTNAKSALRAARALTR